MTRNHLLSFAFGVLFLGFLFSAFVADEKPVAYDYASITQDSYGMYVTVGEENFEVFKVKDQRTSLEDFRFFFKKINEFQSKGWEVTSENVYANGNGAIANHHVMMRKRRN